MEAVMKPRGHRLFMAIRQHEAPFLFCGRCGCYTEERACHLAQVLTFVSKHPSRATMSMISISEHMCTRMPLDNFGKATTKSQ